MTPTPTISITPSSTPIRCGGGITTGSWYYTSCGGNLVQGTTVGLSVIFDYSMPYNGITPDFTPIAVTPPVTPTITPTITPTPSQTQTPTVTPTISVTPSITPTITPTPSFSPRYRLVNNCETFTSFPLGVECFTISEPTGVNTIDGILSLRITGGTTPYSIFWDNGQRMQLISGLNSGSYGVTVTDFYGDYTARTICNLIAPTPTPTPTVTTTQTPTPSPNYPTLCVLILVTNSSVPPLQFSFNGIVNNKPSWSSGSYLMSWNTNTNRWEISGYTLFGGILVSTSLDQIPLSSWSLVGGTANPTINVTTGTCPSYSPFNVTISSSNTDCTGNGSINILTTGGVPPYLYSNNGGASFGSSNIFNNLTAQVYNVVAKDSIGNSTQNNVTINLVGGTDTYQISVFNSQIRTYNAGFKRAIWQVQCIPPLPAGVSISFVLNIESIQDIGGPGTGTISSSSLVNVNGIATAPSSTQQNTITQVRSGCSPETSTITTVIEQYNLTLTSSGTIQGYTDSTLTITNGQSALNGCVTTLSQDASVYLTQPQSLGCSCCTSVVNNISVGGVLGHTLSLGQDQNVQLYYPMVIGLSNSPAGACSDLTLGITRLINSQTFGSGVTVFAGNPSNPQIALGYTYVTDSSGVIYEMIDGVVGLPTGDIC